MFATVIWRLTWTVHPGELGGKSSRNSAEFPSSRHIVVEGNLT